jgi:hypothetical protein
MGVTIMIKFSDINKDNFKIHHAKITEELPKDYVFGYIGNIWGKWASDDRGFYIEDNKGKRISSMCDVNHLHSLYANLIHHLNDIKGETNA